MSKPDRRITAAQKRKMNQYERAIREKVFAAKILSPGEWVYLVGLFQVTKEIDEWYKNKLRQD